MVGFGGEGAITTVVATPGGVEEGLAFASTRRDEAGELCCVRTGMGDACKKFAKRRVGAACVIRRCVEVIATEFGTLLVCDIL